MNDNPLSIPNSLCPACHHFFDSKNGQKIPELIHIKVLTVEEKHICKDCMKEKEAWT